MSSEAHGYVFRATDVAYGTPAFPPGKDKNQLTDWNLHHTTMHDRGVTVVWKCLVSKGPTA